MNGLSVRAIAALLVPILGIGCTKPSPRITLSDATGEHVIVYDYTHGFMPSAKTREDIRVVTDSAQVVAKEAQQAGDVVVIRSLQRAFRDKDVRSMERIVVEYRAQQLFARSR